LSSIEKLWPKGICASTFEGSWISKTWDSKVGCISVEDFTDRSQNVARAVGKEEVKKIYKCIKLSMSYVFAFMDGQVQGSRLREVLFGKGAITTTLGTPTTNFVKNETQPCSESVQTKRRLTTEGWGGTQQTLPSDPILTKRMRSMRSWGGQPRDGWGGAPRDGWGGAQEDMPFGPILTKMPQATEGWGGAPTDSWAGAPIYGWGGRQQPIALGPIQTRQIQSTVGWSGAQQAFSLDPIQPEQMRFQQGWGRM
ncbi:unnamed protein product, partial [Ilex paraguariensis]